MPLYCAHLGSTDRIFVFPEDTPNGGTPSGTDLRSFNLPTTISQPLAIAIDGDDLYIADFRNSFSRIHIVSASTANGTTATVTRFFDLLTTISQIQGLAIDGNDLYVADANSDTVAIVSKNTANNTTATITRSFTFPSAVNLLGLAIDGNDLYAADGSGDDIIVVPKNTADGTTLTTSDYTRRFSLPSNNADAFAITIAGTDLFTADRIDRASYAYPVLSSALGNACADLSCVIASDVRI